MVVTEPLSTFILPSIFSVCRLHLIHASTRSSPADKAPIVPIPTFVELLRDSTLLVVGRDVATPATGSVLGNEDSVGSGLSVGKVEDVGCGLELATAELGEGERDGIDVIVGKEVGTEPRDDGETLGAGEGAVFKELGAIVNVDGEIVVLGIPVSIVEPPPVGDADGRSVGWLVGPAEGTFDGGNVGTRVKPEGSGGLDGILVKSTGAATGVMVGGLVSSGFDAPNTSIDALGSTNRIDVFIFNILFCVCPVSEVRTRKGSIPENDTTYEPNTT